MTNSLRLVEAARVLHVERGISRDKPAMTQRQDSLGMPCP